MKKNIEVNEAKDIETKLKEEQKLYPKISRTSSITSISSRNSNSQEPNPTVILNASTMKIVKKTRSRAHTFQPMVKSDNENQENIT